MKLDESAVGICFATTSLYTGEDKALFATPWPAGVMPIDQLDGPIQVFMEDMRAYLLNGTIPS